MLSSHRTRVRFCTLAAVAAGCVASAAGAATAPRAADMLSGRVVSAAGRWHHDSGTLAVRLVPGSGGATRHLVVRVTGVGCAGKHGCLKLQGKLIGTITERPAHPDVGEHLAIKASGTLTPLGHVSATGLAIGTGSIARGRVTLRLTFTAAQGKVTVSLASRPVGSFTAP